MLCFEMEWVGRNGNGKESPDEEDEWETCSDTSVSAEAEEV